MTSPSTAAAARPSPTGERSQAPGAPANGGGGGPRGGAPRGDRGPPGLGGERWEAAQNPRVPLLVDPLAGRVDEGLRLPEDVVEELVVVVEYLPPRAQVLHRLPGADLLAGPVGDLEVLR